jgi:magnesium chelatase subunit I
LAGRGRVFHDGAVCNVSTTRYYVVILRHPSTGCTVWLTLCERFCVRHRYPFAAIVGQEEMKLALLIAATDSLVGGVLILGHRGTAKSTAIRALAALLPPISVVEGCRYGCDPSGNGERCEECRARMAAGEKVRARKTGVPVVDLPLGATEDRVAGTLDIERALRSGEKAFEAGLLARANRGWLYVDEVNLLDDHLVDLLLDVAVSGENVVEREGISIRHPARFVLVGSGNPEEGDLRPQLLDRFGLAVEVLTPTDPAVRVEVILRRDAFDRDPEGFVAKWHKQDLAVRRQIVQARERIPAVTVAAEVVTDMATVCAKLGTDGVRGELTVYRAARALAALRGDVSVTRAHVRAVAALSLRHRLRRDPLDETSATSRVERAIVDTLGAA